MPLANEDKKNEKYHGWFEQVPFFLDFHTFSLLITISGGRSSIVGHFRKPILVGFDQILFNDSFSEKMASVQYVHLRKRSLFW